MSVYYRTKGFVFKKNERLEADQVFSVFTKDFGKLELNAKAIRKITSKLRSGIDIFYLSEIEFIQGKNNKTLTDAVVIKKIDNFLIFSQVAQVLDDFIQGQEKDERTYLLLESILEKADSSLIKFKNSQLLFHYFFWNFISLQGYQLQADKCSVCFGKLNPLDVYFSSRDGGAVCGECKKNRENYIIINSDIVKTLRLILKNDLITLSKLKISPASQVLLDNIFKNATKTFCPAYC